MMSKLPYAGDSADSSTPCMLCSDMAFEPTSRRSEGLARPAPAPPLPPWVRHRLDASWFATNWCSGVREGDTCKHDHPGQQLHNVQRKI